MEFTIRYDERVLQSAVNTFMRRRLGQGFGWLGLLALVVVSVSLAMLLWEGDRSWVVGAIITTILLTAIFLGSIWFWRRCEMREKLAAIPNRTGLVKFDDETISIVLPVATTTLPWTSFSEVWKLDDCWLLFLAPNNFVTLPIAGVPPDVLDLLTERLSLHSIITSK